VGSEVCVCGRKARLVRIMGLETAGIENGLEADETRRDEMGCLVIIVCFCRVECGNQVRSHCHGHKLPR